MTDAATRRRRSLQSRCDTFGQTVPASSRGRRFPVGTSSSRSAAISSVAASEVMALPTVERRIVRKDITRW
jgi:hypothetical protein